MLAKLLDLGNQRTSCLLHQLLVFVKSQLLMLISYILKVTYVVCHECRLLRVFKSSAGICLFLSTQEMSSVLGIATRKDWSEVTAKSVDVVVGFFLIGWSTPGKYMFWELLLFSNAIVSYCVWTKIFIQNCLIKKITRCSFCHLFLHLQEHN